MQTITCERRLGSWVAEYVPLPCVAIRAERYTGRGDASIHYFAKTEAGEWVSFRKADNRRLKLPTATQLTWRPPEIDKRHRHGLYGMHYGTIQQSEEVSLN